jgi:hypothetical protein
MSKMYFVQPVLFYYVYIVLHFPILNVLPGKSPWSTVCRHNIGRISKSAGTGRRAFLIWLIYPWFCINKQGMRGQERWYRQTKQHSPRFSHSDIGHTSGSASGYTLINGRVAWDFLVYLIAPTGTLIKGIVRRKLTGVLIDIKRKVFVSWFAADNFFLNLKGLRPLNMKKLFSAGKDIVN